jgi:ribosomal protein L31E
MNNHDRHMAAKARKNATPLSLNDIIAKRGIKGIGRKPRVRCDFKNDLLGFERVRKTVTYFIGTGLRRVACYKTRVIDLYRVKA